MNKENFNNRNLLLKKIEKRANYLLKHNYNKYIHSNINNLIIESIMCNGRCHIVSIFKNYLIEDDFSEYIHKFYKLEIAQDMLKDLFYYHLQTSFIFPNYCPLIESKYLYNNVVRKQRIIDEQQEIEDENNSKDNKKKEKKEEKEGKEEKDKLFTSSVYDEILNLSESVMRIAFGLKKQKYNTNLKDILNSKNEKRKKNYYDIDNNLNDINDSSEIDDLIKKLNDEEIKSNNMNKDKNENINKNVEKNAKDINTSKLKLVLKNINSNRIKHKNTDIFHTITNHSINISNAFNNNIKTLMANKDNKIININNINNIYITNNEGNINKKIINKNIINIINKYRKKNNNNSNNSKILSQKIKSMDSKRCTLIPYQSLYGLNFINKNPLINDLININSNNNNNNINSNIKYPNSRNNKKINFYSILNSKPSFMNNVTKNNSTIKLNGSNISNKFINKISKLDFDKLDTINNNILTITNRRKSRNYDKFFKNSSLTMSKRRKKKKINIRNIINPTLSLSPFHKKEKNHQMLYINKKSEKSMNSNRNNIITNSISESIKQFSINEYNFIKRINCENIIKNKGNYSIKSFK